MARGRSLEPRIRICVPWLQQFTARGVAWDSGLRYAGYRAGDCPGAARRSGKEAGERHHGPDTRDTTAMPAAPISLDRRSRSRNRARDLYLGTRLPTGRIADLDLGLFAVFRLGAPDLTSVRRRRHTDQDKKV
jgi:hypothetical protein